MTSAPVQLARKFPGRPQVLKKWEPTTAVAVLRWPAVITDFHHRHLLKKFTESFPASGLGEPIFKIISFVFLKYSWTYSIIS
jgi:hypothetical protein